MHHAKRQHRCLLTTCLLLTICSMSASAANYLQKQRLATKRHDAKGYPEDARGQLVWQTHPQLGRITFLKDNTTPSLVYYQYRNRQRDAIFLARWDDITDNLPDGRGILLKRGSGAVKFNAVTVSGLEGMTQPHFGDNIKYYKRFTIMDYLVGFGFGVLGPEVDLRLVIADSFILYLNGSVNILSGLNLSPLLGSFNYKAGIGLGARFPAPVQLPLLGKHYWGVTLDLAVGLGDANNDGQHTNAFIPGLNLEITKCTYGDRSKARPGGVPYNYHVTEFFLKIGFHLDTTALASGLSLAVSAGVRFTFLGSAIPGHVQKDTETVYQHPRYLKKKAEERRQFEKRKKSFSG